MTKQDLIRTLHESRDHAKDGGELGGYLCNCAEYVDVIWPAIMNNQVEVYEDAIDYYDRSAAKAVRDLQEAIAQAFLALVKALTPRRKS